MFLKCFWNDFELFYAAHVYIITYNICTTYKTTYKTIHEKIHSINVEPRNKYASRREAYSLKDALCAMYTNKTKPILGPHSLARLMLVEWRCVASNKLYGRILHLLRQISKYFQNIFNIFELFLKYFHLFLYCRINFFEYLQNDHVDWTVVRCRFFRLILYKKPDFICSWCSFSTKYHTFRLNFSFSDQITT